MYRVAICDDEDKQREIVKGLLIALSIKVNIDFEIEGFSSGEQLVSHYERNAPLSHFNIGC